MSAVAERPTTKFDKMRLKFMGATAPKPLGYDGATGGQGDGATKDENDAYAQFAQSLDKIVWHDRGQRVTGVISTIDQDGATIDLGGKAPAFLPTEEATLDPDTKIQDILELGQQVEVEIIRNADPESVTVSIRRILTEQAWEHVGKVFDEGGNIEATVSRIIKGGALVRVMGLQAFLPGSQVVGGPPTEALLGKKLLCKVLNLEPYEKLMVSNKNAVLEDQIALLVEGSVVEGTVTSVKPFGAFIDTGVVSGLLHISQISTGQFLKPPDVERIFPLGSKIKALIMSVDIPNRKMSLSTKNLEAEPGDMLKDPQAVYEHAEEGAALFRERVQMLKELKEQDEALLAAQLKENDSVMDILDAEFTPAAPETDAAPAAREAPVAPVPAVPPMAAVPPVARPNAPVDGDAGTETVA
jgi:small subunit ribosomal protein S1